MSLPVLVAMVVVGVSAIVIAVHLTGGTARAVLADAAAARTRFLVDYPDEEIAAVYLTGDRTAAFLELANGHVGLVHTIGDSFFTRCLTPADVKSMSRDGTTALALRLHDFTWAGDVFHFADEETRSRIEMLFAPHGPNERRAA